MTPSVLCSPDVQTQDGKVSSRQCFRDLGWFLCNNKHEQKVLEESMAQHTPPAGSHLLSAQSSNAKKTVT